MGPRLCLKHLVALEAQCEHKLLVANFPFLPTESQQLMKALGFSCPCQLVLPMKQAWLGRPSWCCRGSDVTAPMGSWERGMDVHQGLNYTNLLSTAPDLLMFVGKKLLPGAAEVAALWLSAQPPSPGPMSGSSASRIFSGQQ